ncbi:DinB family protein [Dyadobacter flavalbus]|uniref:DinB family protein n=1 Tax=Dyadobacter flavalbus TaxID=2579942 RepID=A0A5M8QSQ4_9BACT|nr:DinB family protein [Dyadobacter flavalbus]KAA6439129.1 DinB family protein [Dyadobacter flavalbus]
MKPVDKYPFLKNLENMVEKHISETIALFQNQPEELLNRPSETGGWSIAQCLDHLNSYGNYYLPLINKKLSAAKSDSESPFSGTWLGSYFVKMMEPGPAQKKYKAHKNHVPAAKLNAVQTIETFITQQETMLLYLRDAQSKDINNPKIPLSVARIVRINVGDVFRFLVTHNERHMQQAKRNLVHKPEPCGFQAT